MPTYYTKCGRSFNKSVKADTTGFHLEETDGQVIDSECAQCPFVIDVTEGWPDRKHKRFECRAGSQSPNTNNDWIGSLKDKCTLQVLSLDHEFCESVIAFSREHPELSASYNQDSSDCRRRVSVSCSQNKKGVSAKAELVEKFFPSVPATPDPSFEPLVVEEEVQQYKPKCPFLGSTGDGYIHCQSLSCRVLNNRQFKTKRECRDYADNFCFSRFLDCEKYAEYYGTPELYKPEDRTCIHCCNSSWYTGLPKGYDGQEYCYCQKAQLPKKHKDSCAWFNRHPEWPLEESIGSMLLPSSEPYTPETCDECLYHDGIECHASEDVKIMTPDSPSCGNFCPASPRQYSDVTGEDELPVMDEDTKSDEGVQELTKGEPEPGKRKQRHLVAGICEYMREDCPCFCDHNDGCAVKLSSGSALKSIIQEFGKMYDIQCDVFRDAAAPAPEEEQTERNDMAHDNPAKRNCGDCGLGHWYSYEYKYTNRVRNTGGTEKVPCEPHTHYCHNFVEGSRKIAHDNDFDPDTAPSWCPLEEERRLNEKTLKEEAETRAKQLEKQASIFSPSHSPVDLVEFDYSGLDEDTRDALMLAEKEIIRVKMQTVYEIGKYLTQAHGALAKAGSGTFGTWCEHIGFSRQTAQNHMQAYDFIRRNFDRPELANDIQPSLLFAASKPSAPLELAQAVVDGDITRHKDYQEALQRAKKAEEALAAQQTIERDYRNRLAEVERTTEAWKASSKQAEQAALARTAERDAETKKAKDNLLALHALEQQLEQAKRNSDPAKLRELGEIIREKQVEISELEKQLREKPIEIPAVDLREVIPESVAESWAVGVRTAIEQIASLTGEDLVRLVKIIGTQNYQVMKGPFREKVLRAEELLVNLAGSLTAAPAPAADFVKWVKEEGV